MDKNYLVLIEGVVQGVGFRPFIYKLANKYNFKGEVLNSSQGVLVFLKSNEKQLASFILAIKKNAPPLAEVHSITWHLSPSKSYKSFKIANSKIAKEKLAFYSPDTALCNTCLKELFDSKNRRYQYPLINCINCGPRFSIVKDIPYDRSKTSMSNFKTCPNCQQEFKDPNNVRFHNQPISCFQCGPQFSLLDIKRKKISSDIDEIVIKTLDFIEKGKILAIKGVGGFHLVVNALDDVALAKLRKLKNRPFKPLALMIDDLELIKDVVELSSWEEELLNSKERPIVLIKEKRKYVSRLVAPGVSSLGIMRPYTPFQYQLFRKKKGLVLVMTSANFSEEPIIFEDDKIFESLKNIVDYVVTYNREIISPNDDSVLFVEEKEFFFIRRSRGYVPLPFSSKESLLNILAMGSDLKNSFALAKRGQIILSQYLGDMFNLFSSSLLKKEIDHFIKTFAAEPDLVVSDFHPNFFTTSYADEIVDQKKRLKVQHHHAHLASVLEDQGLEEKVIGIIFDGTGYGLDGHIWGGEFLVGDKKDFIRAAHFSYFPLPGGEMAIKEIWRIGLSLLYNSFDGLNKNTKLLFKGRKIKEVVELIEKKVNCPMTCSVGRIFDGVAAILGIRDEVSTEAEAAQLLEEEACLAKGVIPSKIIDYIETEEGFIIDVKDLIKYLVFLQKEKFSIPEISLAFHNALVDTALQVCQKIRYRYSLDKIIFSGGSFQNRIIFSKLLNKLKASGFQVYYPQKVPFNDGCIALGQIAVAREWLLKNPRSL